ncbi:transglycosylase SLT domain-containing protein [Chitinibacter bivalviorum]|uniref:Transglycosylase SLT domain-containing protein n=1 Tax=Chitinibacter bivalviorum TaxID=2739434 RepID=A0A7H9BGG7_9NEIS|nr:transglycosylase SLT domain-containing protein [Chitinibacter bivalviorum]QLG87356.1 transglycosylase SLT domain-containing protein [Chitinibacter bivalviorum]
MKRALSLFFRVFFCLVASLMAVQSMAASKAKPKAAAVDRAHPVLQQASELAQDGQYDSSNPPARLRVLVALGPSTYFIKYGKPHGLEYAFLQGFEAELNRRRAKNRPPIRFQYIPIDAGELIPALREGRGDIAAGMIPYSEGLKSLIAVTEPYAKDEWCLVSHTSNPITFENISQKPLSLGSGSLGRRLLATEGKTDLVIEEPATGFNAEMVLREIDSTPAMQTLASKHIFKLWSPNYANLKQAECLSTNVSWVWGVRKENHALAEDLNAYINSKNSVTIEKAIEQTRRFLIAGGKVESTDKISSMDKLAIFAPIFQTAAAANNVDWLLLAAIGQKESKLSAVIRKKGPTGVMQINPSTARAMGVSDPHGNEGNISAAAIYLGYLRKMFSKQGVTEENQLYFMIAAYNAGEGRLQQLRNQTQKKGLDPNVWVGNVEQMALHSVSKGMVDYVSTVNRLYLAYQAAEKVTGKQKKATDN